MAKTLSTTKKAIALIRGEIRTYYGPAMTGSNKKAIRAMKEDADAYNCGPYRTGLSDWQKGAGLVDAGCFRCHHVQQADFLAKIYGERVAKWSGEKIHKTYSSLIEREYARLIKKARI